MDLHGFAVELITAHANDVENVMFSVVSVCLSVHIPYC